MKITNVRTRETKETISLLADCKIRRIGWDTVYFTFDKKYKGYLYEDASPFAAALLIPSISLGEDLVINGSISRKLYEGMQQIGKKIFEWNILANRAEVKAERVVEDEPELKPRHVGTFFSGGVDSFYTYLKHEHDKNDPIGHFVLMNGTDIDLRNKVLWKATKENIQKIAERSGVELIAVETNIQVLLEPMISPDFTHGGALAAVGLCLRKGLKKIYIPATFSVEEQIPYGSHPELDHYWSTETIQFDHDGTEATRFNKIDWQITKSPLALEYLRVCYMNSKGTYNCGKCEKCLRTMISLYALGKLGDAKTFPSTIDPARAKELAAHSGPVNMGIKQNLAKLHERNIDPPLQQALEEGLASVTDDTKTNSHRLFKKIQYLDHMYFYGTAFRIWTNLKHRY